MIDFKLIKTIAEIKGRQMNISDTAIDDLFQDLSLLCIEKFNQYDNKKSCEKTYITTICRNYCNKVMGKYRNKLRSLYGINERERSLTRDDGSDYEIIDGKLWGDIDD